MATHATKTAATESVFRMIDPKLIDVKKGFNPRIDMGDIDRLTKQIRDVKSKDPKSGGLLQNLNVRPKEGGRFELIDGERRFTGVQILLKKGEDFPFGVPVRVVEETQDEKQALLQAFIANEGKPLTPLERGTAFKRLRDMGMTLAQIEKATGYSDNTINDEMALLDAPEELKEAVKSKKVSSTVAKKIAVHARGDVKKQKALTKQAVAAGKNKKKRDALEQALEKTRRTKAAKQGKQLKMQPVSTTQLTTLGVKAQRYLATKMKEAKIEKVMDLRGWVAESEERAAAYQFGVLQALRVVAGERINLDI